MKTRLLALVALMLLLAACQPTTPAPPAPGAISAPQRRGNGVIVLSLDGARADILDQSLVDGTMPNLAKLAASGVKAPYSQTVDPSLTAAAHASLATGSYPGKTGVVANTYHLPNQPIYSTVSGLSGPTYGVEPVWRTAMKAGLRTATVIWPGAGLDSPNSQQADYTVAFGASEALSNQYVFRFQAANGWAGAPNSFSPPRETTFAIKKDGSTLATIHILAADITDDGQANYDTFFLAKNDKSIGPASARLTADTWARLEISDRLKSAAWFKITNPDLANFTLYQSHVIYNQASPPELAQAINGRFGASPPTPDSYAFEHGWIGEADYIAMAERAARWTTDVAAYVWNTYQPDLMFTWQDPTDAFGHQFLLADPRQKGYAEHAQSYAANYRRAYAMVDAEIGRLLQAVEPARTNLLVVSDHGMAPIHSYVYVNKVLIDKGLMVLEPGGRGLIDIARTKANAVTSGGTVHVYVNLAGREQNGSVPQSDYAQVQDDIVRALGEIKDPVDGQPVFTRILRREELPALHLDTPNAGDVVAQARPGFYPSFQRDKAAVFEPTEFYGQHGYDASLPEMRAIFVAAGPGIHAGANPGPVRVVDVAPTVARLLGFEPAATVDGRSLINILK